jgi:hypothetical protein
LAAPQDEVLFVAAHHAVARWMLTTLTPTSRAAYYRRPGIITQGHAVFGAIGALVRDHAP